MRATYEKDLVITDGLWVDARAYGDSLNDTTLQAAITAIGSDEKKLVITPGDWSITDDVTVPSNISLRVERGAVLQISTTKTLTINGALEAGIYQIFSGPGDVVSSYPKKWCVDWFANNSTPGTTDMSDAFENAYAACQNGGGGVVYFGPGEYAIADIVLPQNDNLEGIYIHGEGQSTILVPSSSHTSGNFLITMAGTDADATQWIELRDLFLYGNNDRAKGILVQPSNNCRLENITILNFDGTGLETQRAYDLYCIKVRVKNSGSYTNSEPGVKHGEDSITGSHGNYVWWHQCVTEENEYYQVEIAGCSNFECIGGKLHGFPDGDSHEEYIDALLYIDGSGGKCSFRDVLFTHAHYGPAVYITDVDGGTPGLNPYSMFNAVGCHFINMESHTPASYDLNVIYCDIGDSRSQLFIDSCVFDESTTGLGTSGKYIYITNDTHDDVVRIGNNMFVDTDTDVQLSDLRTDADELTSGGVYLDLTAKSSRPYCLSVGSQVANGVELTVASGVITVTESYHKVDTESDDLTDDLLTINGGRTGQILVLQSANNDRDTTLKDGTGNLQLAGDFVLSNIRDKIMLICVDGSNWHEISRSDNS